VLHPPFCFSRRAVLRPRLPALVPRPMSGGAGPSPVSQRSPSSEPMFNVPPAALANGGRARARPRGAAAAFAHLISYRGADDRRLRGDFRHDGCGDALVFQQGGPLAVWRRQSDGKSYRVPASPLSATLREPQFLIFLAVWIGLNDCLVSAHADPPKRGSSSPGRRISAAFLPASFSSTRSGGAGAARPIGRRCPPVAYEFGLEDRPGHLYPPV
jgi:hypothetical protein